MIYSRELMVTTNVNTNVKRFLYANLRRMA